MSSAQAFITAACSAGSFSLVKIIRPWSSRLARAIHAEAMPANGAQLLPGAPARMPSKSVGKRWARARAWRPPLETPSK